jgi:hypothetical protein
MRRAMVEQSPSGVGLGIDPLTDGAGRERADADAWGIWATQVAGAWVGWSGPWARPVKI